MADLENKQFIVSELDELTRLKLASDAQKIDLDGQ